jgi:hypothetical protein
MTAAQAVQFAEAERIRAACAWFASRTISSTPLPGVFNPPAHA